MGYESAAQLFAVAAKHPMVGLLNLIGFWWATFLFGGFLIAKDDVPWPLKALVYISPIRYTTRSVIYSEFEGTTFEGAVVDASDPRGFTCPGRPLSCWGATGEQVLQS